MIKSLSKSEWLWVGLVLLLGGLLRLIKLDIFPAGLHGDEAWTGLEALRILKEGFIGFWSPSSYGNPALINYFTALVFKLTEPSVAALRFSLAILNVFWLPFFYLLVRKLFNKPVALLSTFLLATGFVALAFARKGELLALNFAFFPSLYFSLQAYRTGKLKYYLLAGAFLGLNLHTNQPFWITPVLVLALFGMAFIFNRRFNLYFIYLLILVFLVSWPILRLGLNPESVLFARFHSILISSPASLNQVEQQGGFLANLKATLLVFVSREDLDIRDYFYHGPVLDIFSRVLMLIGVISLPIIPEFRKKQSLLLYGFFIVFLSGSIFTIGAPNARRMQPSIYLAYVFVAIGIYAIFLLAKRSPKIMRRAITIGLVVGIVYLGLYNIRIYFRSAVSKDAKYIMAYPLTEVASFVKSNPDAYVYFYSDRWSYRYETLKFLLDEGSGEDRSHKFGHHSLVNNRSSGDVIYIFFPEYSQDLELVHELYPSGIAENHLDTDGGLLFKSYHLKM